MGGTLKSEMRCGCEFWEMLNHMGEMVPDFRPCKEHTGIRERQLEATNAELLGTLKAYVYFTKWVPDDVLKRAKQAIRKEEENER